VANSNLILNPPHMDVKLKPGRWVAPAALARTIKQAGYTPIMDGVVLVVTGVVTPRDGALSLALDEMREPRLLPLVAAKDAKAVFASLRGRAGETVRLELRWIAPMEDTANAGEFAVLKRVDNK